MLEVLERRQSLAAALQGVRARGERIGLVPTMGALHEGHRALLAASVETCGTTVVSVFVNPLQFEDRADLDAYPRTLEEDLGLAEAAGARLCFAPPVEEMYPSGRAEVHVDPGPIGLVLEGASRPGHFAGVATVVTKLLAAVQPDAAFFGEKDYQQLVLVRRLVADLSFPAEVVAVETVREDDGLALSSRNRRLSPAERAAAPALHAALVEGREVLLGGGSPSSAESAMAAALAEAPLVVPDYAVIRDATDLSEVDDEAPPAALRLLVAARVGPVRLLDNLGVRRDGGATR